MDISKLKNLHSQIEELRERADATDSKKETYLIQRKIKELENNLESTAYDILDEIPDNIKLRLTVNKVINYDTTDFKNWMIDSLLERDNLDDLDIMEELKISIEDDSNCFYYLDSDDVNITLEND